MNPERKKKNTDKGKNAGQAGGDPSLDPSLSCQVEANEPEPKASAAYPSVGLVSMVVVLIYFGQLYLHQHGGGFHAQVYEPFLSFAQVREFGPQDPEQMLFAREHNVYSQACLGCHQMTGMGLPPLYPPLAGSEWVLTSDPGRAIRVVLHGLTGPIEVKGQAFNGTMVGLGDVLSSEDVASVLTYVRREWGNAAPAVEVAQVEAIREATRGRTRPWTGPELDQVAPQ
jgi:mono/diheme cytochrome c family protein